MAPFVSLSFGKCYVTCQEERERDIYIFFSFFSVCSLVFHDSACSIMVWKNTGAALRYCRRLWLSAVCSVKSCMFADIGASHMFKCIHFHVSAWLVAFNHILLDKTGKTEATWTQNECYVPGQKRVLIGCAVFNVTDLRVAFRRLEAIW